MSGYSGPYVRGTTVSMTCNVAGGNPPPTVAWYREGTVVGSTATYTTTLEEEDDAKAFSCKATSAGSVPVTSTAQTMEVHCECLLKQSLGQTSTRKPLLKCNTWLVLELA